MAEVMHGSRLALPISLELRAIPSRTMAYASPLIALVLTMVFGLRPVSELLDIDVVDLGA